MNNPNMPLEGEEQSNREKVKLVDFKSNKNIITINRPCYTKLEFNNIANYKKTDPNFFRSRLFNLRRKIRLQDVLNRLLTLFPFVTILRSYKTNDFLKDIIAGLTVGIMHIPQGMAYGMLTNVGPIVGLYTSFFPTLVYFFFGTSKQISLGTMAVVSLMVGDFIDKQNCDQRFNANQPTLNETNMISFIKYFPNNEHGISTKSNSSLVFNKFTSGSNIFTGGFISRNNTREYINDINIYKNNKISYKTSISVLKNNSSTRNVIYNIFQRNNLSDIVEILKIDGFQVDEVLQCKIKYMMALTFTAGIFQLLFALLQFGFVTKYLSNAFTRGLTTGAVFHIVTSQMKHVFGFKTASFNGIFKLPKIYIEFFNEVLVLCNVSTLIMAVICIILIYSLQKWISPVLNKHINMPLPVELIMLVLCTSFSYLFRFSSSDVFSIKVVGNIPQGFPTPSLPDFSIIPECIKDSLSISIVSFAITISLAKLFASNNNYDINSNQELFAYGLTNVIGSTMQCYINTASLSRSFIQFNTGGKTQIAGLVSCCLLFVVIYAIGPLFKALPNCVLAAIVIVNLKGAFLQIMDLNYLRKISYFDTMIWVLTFLIVVFSEVYIGLIVGLVFSIFSIIFRTQSPKIRILGRIANTECYEDIALYQNAQEIQGLKIISFDGPAYFASSSLLLDKLKLNKFENFKVKLFKHNNDVESKCLNNLEHVIIDCGGMTFIDADGIAALNSICKEYVKSRVSLSLTRCNDGVFNTCQKAIKLKKLSEIRIFQTIHDAVIILSEKQVNNE